MAAFEFGIRRPVPEKEMSENLRFHFAFFQRFIALLIAGVIFALGINGRDENKILSVRRPDRAIGSRRQSRYLTGRAAEFAGRGIKIANPNLRWIGRLGSEVDLFAIR